MPTTEQGGSVKWTIEADSSQFEEAVDKSTQSAKKLGDVVSDVDKQIKGSNPVESLGKASSKTSAVLAELGRSVAAVGWNLFSVGATTAAGALTTLVNKGLQATDFLETARVSMSGLTGSIEEGNKAMSIAANYWQNNPFQRIDVTKATQQLIQFGRKTTQISDDLKLLGNVSLSTGVQIDELARYYARTAASGRAMTLDIEMMSDRGIPIYRELAKTLNTTEAGVRDFASKGKIDFETFRTAMENAINPEAMAQYEDTLARQKDRLGGSIQTLAGQLAGYKIINDQLVISANGLEKAYTRFLKTLATELRGDKLKTAMEKLGQVMAQLLDKVTEKLPIILDKLGTALQFIGDHSATLVPILLGILSVVGRLGVSLPGIGGVLGVLGGNFGRLSNIIKVLVKESPLLAGGIALVAGAFMKGMKDSEGFRESVSSLLSKLGDLAKNLIKALTPLLNAIVQFISSETFVNILGTVVDILTVLATVLASIPTEVLTGLITFFVVARAYNTAPLLGIVTAIALVSGAFKQLWSDIQKYNLGEALNNILKGVVEFIVFFPRKMLEIGKNIMVGLYNGLLEGSIAVINYVQNLARSIINTFKSIFAIHSPSKVTTSIGEFVTLGLAEGITSKESAVQKAIDSLASDVLSLADKVIGNRKDFGLIDYNGMYKDWKKVRDLFTVGSQQYASAMAKMEEARKQVNLRILSLQEAYNDALDNTISKIKSMYGLFQKVDLTGGMGSQEIIGNLDQQVAQLQEWASALDIISGLELDPKFVEELEAMGVDSVNELSAIANMTSDELSTLNNLWLKKQDIANETAVKQMSTLKTDTLNEIGRLKDGIEGETVDVQEVGGRLVSNIGEGITGAIPTLESAFSQLDDYIAKATKELAKSGSVAGAESNGGIGSGEGELGVPDAGKTAEEMANELTKTIEESLGQFLPIAIGALGVFAATKLLPGVVKAMGSFGKKGAGEGIGSFFKNLFGKGNVAKEAGAAVSKSSEIANAGNQISNNVSGMSKGMQKVSNVLNLIIKGAVAIVAVAAAIAAMALALRVTYELLKDVNWGVLAVSILAMGVSIAAIGGLAWIGGVMWKEIAKGLLIIAGIAVDMVLLSGALRLSYEFMKEVDWGNFAKAIAMMAIAIVAMGALSAVAGLGPIMAIVGPGLLVIAGIAADIALVSLAIRYAYDNMKDIEWGPFGKMIEQMAAAILSFDALSAISGILGPLVALGWGSIIAVCDEIVRVSRALWEMNLLIPDDFSMIEKKVILLKSVIEFIRDSNLEGLIKSISAKWETGNIVRVAENYVEIAKSLNRLQDIGLETEAIFRNLDTVKDAIDTVKSKTDFISAGLQSWSDSNLASSVESGGRIIKTYAELVEALDKIGQMVIPVDIEGRLTALGNVIGKLREILVKNNWGGDYAKWEWGIGMSTSIAWKLAEFSDAVKEIKDVGNVDGLIEKLGNVIRKIIDTAKGVADEKLPEIENLGATFVERFTTGITNSLSDVQTVARQVQTEFWKTIEGLMDDEYQQGKALTRKLADGAKSISLEDAGRVAQGSFWRGVNSKMDDEYYQGRSMGERFRQGLYDVDYANSGWWAVQGFINGANNRAYNQEGVYHTGWWVADTFLKGLRKRAEEGSPWKTTFESGTFAIEGLIEGLRSSEAELVGEATNIADQVTEALTLESVEMNPALGTGNYRSIAVPSVYEDYDESGGKREVVIEQTNNNYTDYSMQKISSDLAWALSRV